MCCNATEVLKIDFVYNQGENYHLQTYVEGCKYIYVENQRRSMLSDDDGFFEV